MQSIEKRLSALEAAQPAYPFRAIRLEPGESEQAARLRCRIPDDAANVWFIERVIVDPAGECDAEY